MIDGGGPDQNAGSQQGGCRGRVGVGQDGQRAGGVEQQRLAAACGRRVTSQDRDGDLAEVLEGAIGVERLRVGGLERRVRGRPGRGGHGQPADP